MIRGLVIRAPAAGEFGAVERVIEASFGQPDEARLVGRLRDAGDAVLELVAVNEGEIVAHLMFSRLKVEAEAGTFPAVALAPVAVLPERQRTGVGTALIENAHHLLEGRGERLSVVLGEPGYYGRFGYDHARAAGFESDYQCEALQALAWGEAPATGRLVYAAAFSDL